MYVDSYWFLGLGSHHLVDPLNRVVLDGFCDVFWNTFYGLSTFGIHVEVYTIIDTWILFLNRFIFHILYTFLVHLQHINVINSQNQIIVLLRTSVLTNISASNLDQLLKNDTLLSVHAKSYQSGST